MSDTVTGSAMAIPPRDEWLATERGLSCWRPVITEVTVERIDGPDKGRLLTVREDGAVLRQVLLSGAQAAHLARLLVAQQAGRG